MTMPTIESRLLELQAQRVAMADAAMVANKRDTATFHYGEAHAFGMAATLVRNLGGHP